MYFKCQNLEVLRQGYLFHWTKFYQRKYSSYIKLRKKCEIHVMDQTIKLTLIGKSILKPVRLFKDLLLVPLVQTA